MLLLSSGFVHSPSRSLPPPAHTLHAPGRSPCVPARRPLPRDRRVLRSCQWCLLTMADTRQVVKR